MNIIEIKLEDAQPGDRLEKLGAVCPHPPSVCWGRNNRSDYTRKAVADILAAGLDRIIREVPEKKVWYEGPAVVWDKGAPGPQGPWIHVNNRESIGGVVRVQIVPEGQPFPLPDDVAEFVRKKAIEGFLGARELVEEFGL